MSPKLFILCLAIIGVQSRHIPHQRPSFYINDHLNILNDDQEDYIFDEDVVHPAAQRVSRQVHGSMNTNPDGSTNLNVKVPLAGNDNNALSAIGSGAGLKPGGGYGAATGGLVLDNVNGHSLSATKTHIPSFGDQLTAAGKVNLLQNDNHKLDGTAFITRNMPSIPNTNLPNFNTYGGGLDYMYKNKIGASLNAAHTDLFQKTDVSALGRLNLFNDKTSSLDFTAGASRSFSPFIPKSSWEPQAGLSFTKYCNGHSLSATKTHIPSFGDQLTAAGKVNLLQNDNHKLDGTAFITRNMPSIPNTNLPNFNTYGGGLDYMYKNKIGASLNAAHTDLFQKTDVSALGKLDLFNDKTSSLDFTAGASRSFSPFIPKSSWEPQAGLSFTKYW